MKTVEEVFKTEGFPSYTFVQPPNYSEILIDIRAAGKPVIIEGQSGTGKTTTIKRILNELGRNYVYWTLRDPDHKAQVEVFSQKPTPGIHIIDDFHRLESDAQTKIADIVKLAAESETPENHPKVIIVGINRVGSTLIQRVHDIAKRLGIHKIKPAPQDLTTLLLEQGERELNISIPNKDTLYQECKGDYWLTQVIARTICSINKITEEQPKPQILLYTITEIRSRLAEVLKNSYDEPIKAFCRGNRFRPTNDPYYKVLLAISKQDSSIIDLIELSTTNPESRGSINNIKDKRLPLLLQEKPICAQYFFYSINNNCIIIEDPALFYYIKIANWDAIKRECGFRSLPKEYDFDFAISFAGENRDLAKEIVRQLETLDVSIFYDEDYEAHFLGKMWRIVFRDIFVEKCRFVICILDSNHDRKIWPTFERECFAPRASEGQVIPIFLDDTKFVGIPSDIIGISFQNRPRTADTITNEIVYKLIDKLSLI